MKTVAFFSNKGGVGTTSLVYHVAWMFAELGVPVLAVDLDPQANLTAMFLNEERREAVRADTRKVESIGPALSLLPADLGLSGLEEILSDAWSHCGDSNQVAFQIVTCFHRQIEESAGAWAEVVLIDLGPNLGAINRAALIASDYVCFPLTPDGDSLQGLRHAGPALIRWRSSWDELKAKAPAGLSLPRGSMTPAGYVVMQQGGRTWKDEIPGIYQQAVLGDILLFQTYSIAMRQDVPKIGDDPHCLARLRYSRSLMPLAIEARKPMFQLTPVDGAIGAQVLAVLGCWGDFVNLVRRIGAAVGIRVGEPESPAS